MMASSCSLTTSTPAPVVIQHRATAGSGCVLNDNQDRTGTGDWIACRRASADSTGDQAEMYAGVPTSATAFLTRDCHCVRTAVIRLTQKQVICHQWHVFCSGRGVRVPLTYVLPICSDAPQPGELFAYLRWLSAHVEVIIVDGSPAEVFDDHARRLTSAVRHMRPDPRLGDMLNQKVAGVLTGGRCADTSSRHHRRR